MHVFQETLHYEESSIDALIKTNSYYAPCEYYLKCNFSMLKNTKKEKTFRYESKNWENWSFLFLVFLADDALKSLAVVIDNNTVKSHIIDFWN